MNISTHKNEQIQKIKQKQQHMRNETSYLKSKTKQHKSSMKPHGNKETIVPLRHVRMLRW